MHIYVIQALQISITTNTNAKTYQTSNYTQLNDYIHLNCNINHTTYQISTLKINQAPISIPHAIFYHIYQLHKTTIIQVFNKLLQVIHKSKTMKLVSLT